MDKKLLTYLKNLNIEYKIHEHPAVFTVEESNTLVKGLPGLHMKNLFLKDETGNFYLVCIEAEKRLDIKFLRNKLGVKKLHFASEEELKRELHLTPGSVSVFGMIYSKKVILILDKKALNAEKINFHPNINTATLELDKKNFKIFLDSITSKKEIIDLE